MAKTLTRCPVCEGEFKITELTCDRCGTHVQSTFDPCRFCRLPADHLAFVEVFLRCEGNLSRVEKELGVSYPTVRNRLTGALTALGLTAGNGESQQAAAAEEPEKAPEDTSGRRRDTLNLLARGEINAEDAARLLRELS